MEKKPKKMADNLRATRKKRGKKEEDRKALIEKNKKGEKKGQGEEESKDVGAETVTMCVYKQPSITCMYIISLCIKPAGFSY